MKFHRLQNIVGLLFFAVVIVLLGYGVFSGFFASVFEEALSFESNNVDIFREASVKNNDVVSIPNGFLESEDVFRIDESGELVDAYDLQLLTVIDSEFEYTNDTGSLLLEVPGEFSLSVTETDSLNSYWFGDSIEREELRIGVYRSVYDPEVSTYKYSEDYQEYSLKDCGESIKCGGYNFGPFDINCTIESRIGLQSCDYIMSFFEYTILDEYVEIVEDIPQKVFPIKGDDKLDSEYSLITKSTADSVKNIGVQYPGDWQLKVLEYRESLGTEFELSKDDYLLTFDQRELGARFVCQFDNNEVTKTYLDNSVDVDSTNFVAEIQNSYGKIAYYKPNLEDGSVSDEYIVCIKPNGADEFRSSTNIGAIKISRNNDVPNPSVLNEINQILESLVLYKFE